MQQRLLTAIRTKNDAVYYTVSGDRGKSWTEPVPLRYGDGQIVLNPNAPCPMVKLHDGRIVLMFHSAKQSSTFGPRNPIWISIGKEDPDAKQPVRFGAPVKFMEVDGGPPLGSFQTRSRAAPPGVGLARAERQEIRKICRELFAPFRAVRA